jgi:hypothetical protein
MNKLILIFSLLLIPVSSSAESVIKKEQPITQLADLFANLNKTNNSGVYRIIDKEAGSVIYIMTTGRAGGQPQMEVIPFGMLDESTRMKLR